MSCTTDRFFYVLNDDFYQKIQIYLKYNVTKKLLDSYSLFFKLLSVSSSISFRIRLQDFDRKLLGGSCDRFGAESNLVLGIEDDFRIYNEGGFYDVKYVRDRFFHALQLLESSKRTLVEQWARGEDVCVLELHAQQVVGDKEKKERTTEGKVQIEYRPKKEPESLGAPITDVWEKPVEIYANTRRRNKGSLRGPRGKRVNDEEKIRLSKKIKLEGIKKEPTETPEDSSILLHLFNQEVLGEFGAPIKKEKGIDNVPSPNSFIFPLAIKQEKYKQDNTKGSVFDELWQQLLAPLDVKLSKEEVERELEINCLASIEEMLALFDE